MTVTCPYDLVIGLDRSDRKADLHFIDTRSGKQWSQTVETKPAAPRHSSSSMMFMACPACSSAEENRVSRGKCPQHKSSGKEIRRECLTINMFASAFPTVAAALVNQENAMKNTTHKLSGLVSKTALFLTTITAPAWAEVDLSRPVFLGDSLMAGFQNGSLRGSQQVHGIAAVVAKQAGLNLPQPLIAEPGIPNALTLLDPGPPPVIGQLPGSSAGRIDPFQQTLNLSVPGHTVADALTKRPDLPFDSREDLILGLPGLLGGISKSQVEWAEALQPSVIVVWLGNNDALGAALDADATLVTSVADFADSYRELMDRLSALNAPLVVANIPDVTVIPYLTPAENVAAFLQLPMPIVTSLLGLQPGDFVTPNAFGLLGPILTGSVPGPLPANAVLTAAEVAQIRAATAEFNRIIAEEASAHGAALVDTHAFLERLRTYGLVTNGQRLRTGFLAGIFSLDGFHPTNTGYAATANEFIKTINRAFEADIPPINIHSVALEDPLILPDIGHPARSGGVVPGDNDLRALAPARH